MSNSPGGHPTTAPNDLCGAVTPHLHPANRQTAKPMQSAVITPRNGRPMAVPTENVNRYPFLIVSHRCNHHRALKGKGEIHKRGGNRRCLPLLCARRACGIPRPETAYRLRDLSAPDSGMPKNRPVQKQLCFPSKITVHKSPKEWYDNDI